MSIEEAEYILNEAVISEPSISSYAYISAEEINGAIEKILEERYEYQSKINKLEENLEIQKNEFENIIKEKEIEIERLKNKKYKLKYIGKLIQYIKKVGKPLFLLEN